MLWRNKSDIPTDAKSSVLSDLVALHGMGHAQWSGRDGLALAANGFRRNAVAYRCVQLIADSAASVPLLIHQERSPQLEHPLAKLLAQPNPSETGQRLMEGVCGHLQISGNAYLEVIWQANQPIGLYLLRPDHVKIESGPDGWPMAYLHGQQKPRRLPARDENGRQRVIHIRLFNPLNDQYGQSPMAVAGDAIDLHNATVGWNKSLLDNAARPSGALVYRGVEGASNLTGEQFDRLKAELASTYTGARHAGRPMVLDGGLDWKPMSLSPSEMDFMNLKHGAARDIALAFGVPPMMLGIPGDNTYSNYQQAVLAFWRHAVIPLLTKITQALSAVLCEQSERIEFDLDRVDALATTRSERLRLQLDTDVLTQDEKRALLGYPPLSDLGRS